MEGFGVPFCFDVVGICAQDHGVAPVKVSHLDHRHEIFRTALDDNPYPQATLYEKNEVPAQLNRLKSIAASCNLLPADEAYLIDSGMAAILGASLDLHALGKQKIMVLISQPRIPLARPWMEESLPDFLNTTPAISPENASNNCSSIWPMGN
ncbi:MAG TPA: DUF1786 family protein [Syntrophales bacterium]|nr:DUF1786 family protein [Syntrophales bacterium]